MAMRHDNAFRASGAYSLVSARKKGLPPSGSTIGKSATRTKSRFFAASCMVSVTSLPECSLSRSVCACCSNSGKISRMEFRVLFSLDPEFVLRSAEEFLSSEPVLHNMILSILHARLASGDPGRYWIAFHGEKAVGVVLQSPLDFPATLTPMESRAALAIVDAIAAAGVTLPGV